jgi:exodeoxyribonuclease VII large subunit
MILAVLSNQRWGLSGLQNRLQLCSPQTRLRTDQQRLDELARRSTLGVQHSLQLRHAKLAGLGQRLGALNPLAVLGRGYAVVSHPDGQVVRSVRQVQPDDELHIRVSDGQFTSRVLKDG